jgi:threonine/homoserine/homoserine lactone efflux protein
MTTSHALIAFLIASGLLTITPGLDTALVVRTAAVSGGRRAMAAGVGICLGLLVWGFSASAGIGALLNASQAAYNLLRVVGACYLVFLGCRMFFRPGFAFVPNAETDSASAEKPPAAEDPRP